jgi:hypothetical protein
MVSDRAEAMTLGGTAAGVRAAVHNISSVGAVQYGGGYFVDPYDRKRYAVTIVPNYWWWGNPWWAPNKWIVRPDIRMGARCWRQTVGWGHWGACQ